MAKNTSSSAFRKIDVDQYCEDNFKEDEPDQGGPTGPVTGPDENEINSLLQKYPFLLLIFTAITNFYLISLIQTHR